MTTSRPLPGMLLPQGDPRVQRADTIVRGLLRADHMGYKYDPRDAAEIVNAVLAIDDELHDRPIEWSQTPDALPEPLRERPTT